jgi:hypothetical protein
MKSNSVTNSNPAGNFRLMTALMSAILFLGYGASVCQAQFHSPVGTWDCLSSGGGQPGIAYLTFHEDGTFDGYVLVAGKPKSTSTDGRNPGGDAGRGSQSGTNVSNILFGSTSVDGPWSFDSKGRVIGFFIELVNVQSFVTNYGLTCIETNIDVFSDGMFTTNLFVCFSTPTFQVNLSWAEPSSFSTTVTLANDNFTVEAGSAELTNAVSFVGKVVPNRRLTLVASTSFGKVNFKGVPFAELEDFDGSFWYGTKKVNKQSFLEFFTLSGSDFPNIYFMDGAGPGYFYENGRCVISRQKRIGFAVREDTGGLRSTFGPFKSSFKGTTAKTKGVQDPLETIRFDATLQGF